MTSGDRWPAEGPLLARLTPRDTSSTTKDCFMATRARFATRKADRGAVVVTGVGALSPMGASVEALWAALLDGRSGIGSLEEDWPSDIPVRIGGRVPIAIEAALSAEQNRSQDRVQQLAVLAARQAWTDAGAPEVDPDRLAVVVGSAIGGVQTLLAQHDAMREGGA